MGTISCPAPSTLALVSTTVRGAAGSGGGAAGGVLRRGMTSSVDSSIEMRGIAESGEGTGALGALAGIGVITSGPDVSGRKNA